MRVSLRASVVAFTISACSDPTAVCVGKPVLPLIVHANSAIRGESLDSKAVIRITALQPPFESDSGPIGYDPPTLVLARFADQTGSFRVRVDVPGFQPWEHVVSVEAGQCGSPKTITVSASLTPDT